MKPKERLYIAYGSNLNLEQMKHRCPTAKIVGTSVLRGWRLWFRGGGYNAVATVDREEGFQVPVLIWQLRPGDELALDRYEGFPFLYRKEILRVTVNGKRISAMIYIMNEAQHPYGAPALGYFNTIREGYKSAGFALNILHNAANDSKEALQ